MADPLNVVAREELGTRATQRLRATGQVPAVLYGHKEACVHLSVESRRLELLIHAGEQMVDLKGAVNESALIRDVQWDAFGSSVIHVDLFRVSAKEKVEVEVSVELTGEAPGSRAGGVVDQALHMVAMLCPAGKIPQSLVVSINQLELNQSITAADLDLPEGAELMIEPHEVIVQCTEPVAPTDEEEEPSLGGSIEPEVIGKDESEDTAEES